MFAGGAAGAAGAAANNGNVLQGMLTGAVGGAMFYGIGESFSGPGALSAFGRAVNSGFVGGLMAMSQGGRFAHGFAAAGIGSLDRKSVVEGKMGTAGSDLRIER